MSLDVLERVLADLRIAGSVVLHESYRAPWAIDVPSEDTLRALLKVGPRTRVFPFHLVRRGGFELRTPHCEPTPIRCPEVAMCIAGSAHRMASGTATHAFALADLIADPTLRPRSDGDGEITELVCGVFMLDDAPFNPILAALPPVLSVPTTGDGADPVLAHTVEMLAAALKSPPGTKNFATARALEVFCAEVIRAHARTAPTSEAGWFAGLADPKVGAALARIHADPSAAWSLKALADIVHLSPSRFAARFRERMGVSVQRYLTAQRMSLACRRLEDPRASIADIAFAVGYTSVPAFSRAFASYIGEAPGHWRKRHLCAPPTA